MTTPQDAFRKLQQQLQNSQRRFGAGGGGNPRGPIGAIGGLLLLGGVAWTFNNALFNGSIFYIVSSYASSNLD